MKFSGSATRTFSGIFSAADFTTPTVTGDGNDFIVSTAPGLQKVVLVPNAATATVVAEADPDAMTVPGGGVPASNPSLLVLLGSLLLGGATWLLLKRNRPNLA